MSFGDLGELNIVITATDNASAVFNTISNNASSMGNTFETAAGQSAEINTQYGYVAASADSVNRSTLQNVSSMSTLATTGTSLYMAANNIQNAQVSLDRANLVVEKSTNSVNTAQQNYNAAVQKYGENSPQALAALTKLQTAQDTLGVAQERVGSAQRNLNDTWLTSVGMVIPSVISAVTQVMLLYGSYSAAVDTATASEEAFAASEETASAAGVGGVGGAAGGLSGASAIAAGAGAAAAGVGLGVLGVEGLKAAGVQPGMSTGGYAPEGLASARAGWNDPSTFKKIPGFTGTYVAPPGSPDYIAQHGGLVGAGAGGVSNLPSELQPSIGGGKLQVMQGGGVVNEPTFALLGEAGPEAVIPLDELGGGSGNTYNITNTPQIRIDNLSSTSSLPEIINGITRAVRSGTAQGLSDALSGSLAEKKRRRS